MTARMSGRGPTCSSSMKPAGRPSWRAYRPTISATTGQLWGNPLYRWEAHEAEGFAWWIDG